MAGTRFRPRTLMGSQPRSPAPPHRWGSKGHLMADLLWLAILLGLFLITLGFVRLCDGA